MDLGSLFSGAASAAGGANPISAVANVVGSIVDKVWPDPTIAEKAKLDEMKERTADAVALMDAQNRAANAEAASSDKWTSRARPSFMYVMYIMILFGIPIGIISAFSPHTAVAIGDGFKAWLGAIPTTLWEIFGGCYAVYTWKRTDEKKAGVA